MLQNFADEDDLKYHFRDEENCRKYLKYKLWGDGKPICPHCAHDRVYEFKNGTSYKCAACKKRFSLTTGTIFENSTIPLSKWFIIICEYVFSYDGCPAIRLHQRKNITLKTAWFVHQRIMELFAPELTQFDYMDGVYEIDGLGVGPDLDRANRARRAEFPDVAGHAHRPTVVGVIKRGGYLSGTTMKPYPSAKEMAEFVAKYIPSEATIFCDTGKEFTRLKRLYTRIRQFVHYKSKFGGGSEHSNTIEGAFSKFRVNLRRYSRISPNYVGRYFGEFCFQYNNASIKRLSLTEKFDAAMNNVNRRIKLKDLQEQGRAEFERIGYKPEERPKKSAPRIKVSVRNSKAR